jgi:CheY-like chemotaxis protein
VTEPILIIEDEPEDARRLEELLKQLAVLNPIRCFHNAVEAMAYISGQFIYADRAQYPLPKIILLDLKMPEMDGFYFLKWLRTRPKMEDILVFVITGLENVELIRQAYEAGAKSFIQKPCCLRDLQNLINAFPAHWVRAPAGSLKTGRDENRSGIS